MIGQQNCISKGSSYINGSNVSYKSPNSYQKDFHIVHHVLSFFSHTYTYIHLRLGYHPNQFISIHILESNYSTTPTYKNNKNIPIIGQFGRSTALTNYS